MSLIGKKVISVLFSLIVAGLLISCSAITSVGNVSGAQNNYSSIAFDLTEFREVVENSGLEDNLEDAENTLFTIKTSICEADSGIVIVSTTEKKALSGKYSINLDKVPIGSRAYISVNVYTPEGKEAAFGKSNIFLVVENGESIKLTLDVIFDNSWAKIQQIEDINGKWFAKEGASEFLYIEKYIVPVKATLNTSYLKGSVEYTPLSLECNLSVMIGQVKESKKLSANKAIEYVSTLLQEKALFLKANGIDTEFDFNETGYAVTISIDIKTESLCNNNYFKINQYKNKLKISGFLPETTRESVVYLMH